MSDEKKTEELHVWDFDGTLVNTPVPDTGRAQYESETGLPWPHKGWWGRAESLEHPLTWSAGPAMDESQVNAQIDQVRTDFAAPLGHRTASSARAPGGPHGVTGSRFAADD